MEIKTFYISFGASMVAQMAKNLPATQEIQVQSAGSGRSRGEGNINPCQYSYLENSLDRGV